MERMLRILVRNRALNKMVSQEKKTGVRDIAVESRAQETRWTRQAA